jgi:hypothetical protein
VTGHEVTTLVEMMRALWPHMRILTARQEGIYAAVLEPFEAALVTAAVQTMYYDGDRFAPTAGQIRKRVADLADDAPDWDEAWAEINVAIRAVQSRGIRPQDCAFTHSVVLETVDNMGWPTLLHTYVDQQHVTHAQLRTAYEAARKRHRDTLLYGPLPSPRTRRLTR